MSAASLAQYAAFLLIVGLLVRPVGGYLARVFSGERTWLDPVMRPVERAVYRLAGVDAAAEMDWKRYAGCFVGFGLGGTLLLYADPDGSSRCSTRSIRRTGRGRSPPTSR